MSTCTAEELVIALRQMPPPLYTLQSGCLCDWREWEWIGKGALAAVPPPPPRTRLAGIQRPEMRPEAAFFVPQVRYWLKIAFYRPIELPHNAGQLRRKREWEFARPTGCISCALPGTRASRCDQKIVCLAAAANLAPASSFSLALRDNRLFSGAIRIKITRSVSCIYIN